jgi:hypothetical protein
MTGASILPVSIHNGELYFLFGLENEFEDSAKGFSDFGGGVEKGEKIEETALREGGEELTGFLGDGNRLKEHIKNNGGIYKLSFNDYHVHIFKLEYDPNLPKYYNWNHAFLWEKMNKKTLSKTKLFEKIEIQWFSVHTMQARLKEFRPFYQDIVKQLVLQWKNIYAFAQRGSSKEEASENYILSTDSFISSFEKHQNRNGKESRVKGRNENGHVTMEGIIEGKHFSFDNSEHKVFRKTPYPYKRRTRDLKKKKKRRRRRTLKV